MRQPPQCLLALELFINRELHGLHELVEREGSVEERLMLMAEYMITELEQYANLMPIAYEFYALSTRESDIRKSFNVFFQRFIKIFEKLIIQGINQREIEHVDPDETAVAIVGLLEGLTLLWIVGALNIDIGKLGSLLQTSLSQYFHGIQAEVD